MNLRAVDGDVVEQPELDDVHAELRVLDDPERLDHLFPRGHGPV